jgi:hypothetical protein
MVALAKRGTSLKRATIAPVPRFFHDGASQTIYRQGDPSVVEDRTRSRLRGWVIAADIRWMSASVGPDAKIVDHWYDARRDSREGALALFSVIKRTPGLEVDEGEYRRLRSEYGDRFAARSKR